MDSKWWKDLWECLVPHVVRWLAGRLKEWLSRRKEDK